MYYLSLPNVQPSIYSQCSKKEEENKGNEEHKNDDGVRGTTLRPPTGYTGRIGIRADGDENEGRLEGR